MAIQGSEVRKASLADLQILRQALAWAIEWRSVAPSRSADLVIRDSGHDYLLSNWGAGGDTAFVAEVNGHPIGAAWYRFWTDAEHSYGYADSQTPELGIGVDPIYRQRGVGTALLNSLLRKARAEGIDRLSLSVERDNPAMSLYEGVGFVRHHRVDDSWTMIIDLTRWRSVPSATRPDDTHRE